MNQKEADDMFAEAMERSRSGVFTSAHVAPDVEPKSDRERLLLWADSLDREAISLIGCTWTGSDPPQSILRDKARLLRRAANCLPAVVEN